MSGLLQTKNSHIDKLTRDCNIFHGFMFGFSVVCVVGISVIMGGLAATGHVEKEIAGRWVASTTSMWAILLTLYLIYLHMVFYRNPLEQRCIVRILLMVIIYAIDSFCGLIWHKQAIWIGAVRDSYEAYVIFSFMTLMMTYLDGPEKIVKYYWDNGEKTLPHPPPLCCLAPVKLNRSTLLYWEFFTLQYAVINPLLALVTVIIWFSKRELYEEGHMAADNTYPWIAGIRFISVTCAFTSLVYFFLATKDNMASKKPMGKFVSIKLVVFCSFWQSVLLSGLSHFHVIQPTKFWSSDSIATGASNFLLCVEMWMIAVAHKYTFSHEPYAELEPTDDEPDDGDVNWCPRWAVIKDIFFCRDAAEQFRTVVGGFTDEIGEGVGKYQQKIGDKVEALKTGVAEVFQRSDEAKSPSKLTGADAPLIEAGSAPAATAADVDAAPKAVVSKPAAQHET